jgi:hypothetical protein
MDSVPLCDRSRRPKMTPPHAAPSRYGAYRWGLGVGRLGSGRCPRNRMDGPLWRRLRALWFVTPARTMGEPIVSRPARALARFSKSRATFACSASACLSLISRSIRLIETWRSASSRSDEGKLFEGNQLLRIQARQVGVDLDIAIIAIFTLNGADPGVLVAYVALR